MSGTAAPHPKHGRRPGSILRGLAVELPGQLFRVGGRGLAGVALADVGGRPGVARWALGEERYEAGRLRVVVPAACDHLVWQVAGVDRVDEGHRVRRVRVADD